MNSELFKKIKKQNEKIRKEAYEILEGTGIIIIRGEGRTGKTALALDLIEKTDKKLYLFTDGRDTIKGSISNKYKIFSDLEKLNKITDGIVLIDDIAVLGITGRSALSKEARQFQQYLSVISHKDLSIITTIQSMSIFDVKGILVSQKTKILCKYSSEGNLRYERDEYKAKLRRINCYLYNTANVLFNGVEQDIKRTYDNKKTLYYDYTENRIGFNKLPTFYNNEISKAYRDKEVIQSA